MMHALTRVSHQDSKRNGEASLGDQATGGLSARCSRGWCGFQTVGRTRAGSTWRRTNAEGARPRGNPEGHREWGAPLCCVSSTMGTASPSSPRLAEHPHSWTSRQRSSGGRAPNSKERDRGRHRRSLCTTSRATDRAFRSEDREDPPLQPVAGERSGLGRRCRRIPPRRCSPGSGFP